MIYNDFTSGDSFIHRFDPRIKILIALFFSIITALSNKIPAILSFFVLAIILVLISKLKFKILFSRLTIVNIFILFIWFILPFSYPGKIVFHIGSLQASREGLINALEITLKYNAIILCNIALLSTNPIFQLTHAIRHLGAPDKFVHLFFLIHRYAFVIFDEYKCIRDALRARGFRPKTNFFTYRTYAYLVANLLLKSYERSEQVHRAMICRGFTGKYWVLEHFALKWRDIFVAITIFTAITTLAIIQWMKIL
ncbi:cobalt ECF transporter T component CbiQ [candidate division WOR-3 bacterium RBG_13_43_14]|uniref:Cobalt ECF transporter T component CbiQ n=1 Tax=candidate division WOR-3 bacterium RBG_13_43_14 TaxID=1802590 RepID=A0A1F4UAG6_UNCW3|nr:MAG: cobalt ECF transporter T component CbiQ [candidate division WOR-3 bacterium RBG_13_43_14]